MSQEPLIPANTNISNTSINISVKSVGATYTGSVDDILAAIRKKELTNEKS